MPRYARFLWLLILPISLLQCQRPQRSPELWPRAGVVIVGSSATAALDQLGPVWYYEYSAEGDALPGHQRVYLVHPFFSEQRLAQSLRQHRGCWWLVGNEPNDPNQDNLSPGAYAAFYHRFYEIAKSADPSCRVAPAGLANADWAWADAFRQSYREQYGAYPSLDAWNVHNYILEPGADQLDAAEFQRRIIAFRDWMARIGEDRRPLFLTEFGALYLKDRSGADEDPEQVARYIEASVAWLGATDYVQYWAWFANDTAGAFNGDLCDAQGRLTAYGEAYRDAIQEVTAR
jgi:hypothetical protein